MKTNIKPKQLFLNYFGSSAWRIRWANLALMLCLFGFLLPARGQDPKLTNTINPMDTNVSVGATVSFRVYANSTNPPMTFQWQHEGTNLPSATNVILAITNVGVAHAGGYRATIWNVSGDSTNTRTATLTVDPTFIKITTGAIVTDREPSTRASWCDYDADGFQDLFVANQFISGSASKHSLYHNNGDGTFTKITTNAWSGSTGIFGSGVWADVDNDGDPDLYVCGGGPGRQAVFYRNDGNSQFTPVSIDPTRDPASRDSYEVAWGDYDQDGWVDLFIPTIALPSDRLFRNLGDLNFRSMTAAEVGGLLDPKTPPLESSMAQWIDYNNDGHPDMFVSQKYSALYLNSENGFFTQTLDGSITEIISPGPFGCLFSWADYDNDGYLDLLKPHPAPGALHHNLGGTNSVEVTQAGLELPINVIGAVWGDYDNDGNLDLFVTCNPYWVSDPAWGGNNILYRNSGDGTFAAIDVGSPIREGRDEWDASWIDYDNDGFLDLFIAAGPNVPEVNYQYRNNLRATGNANHWLKVSLVGKASNASGIGAKVRLTANIRGKSVTQLRMIESPGYFGSNQGLLAHFGLGDATKVDTLRIEWPSGIVQEWKDVAVDQHLTKVESQNSNPGQPPQFTTCGRATDGTFQATVTCSNLNALCVFEASTNLVQWTKLSVRANTTGTMQFDDPGATNRPARFYRVVVP